MSLVQLPVYQKLLEHVQYDVMSIMVVGIMVTQRMTTYILDGE